MTDSGFIPSRSVCISKCLFILLEIQNMQHTKFLKMPEVVDRTGKSKSTIWAAIKAGAFPTPIKIGPRAIGFIEAEIEAYNQACIDASRLSNQDRVDSPEMGALK